MIYGMDADHIVAIPQGRCLTWRDENTLQLGVDSPVVVQDASVKIQRLVTLLQHGTTLAELRDIAIQYGLTDAEFDAFMEDVQPVLRSATPDLDSPRTVIVVDAITERSSIVALLRALGYLVIVGEPGIPEHARGPVVTIERFFHDTLAQQHWLSRGLPVLPVRYSDQSVHVGPWLREDGPCGHCLNIALAERQSGWKEAATQLMGRRAPTEHPAVHSLALSFVLRSISGLEAQGHGVSGQASDTASQFIADFQSGSIQVERVDADFSHASCDRHRCSPIS